jgi:hypothetical protein
MAPPANIVCRAIFSLSGLVAAALINASWLGGFSMLKCGPTVGALLLLRCRMCVFGSCGGGNLHHYNHLYHVCVMLLVCVPNMYYYVDEYK